MSNPIVRYIQKQLFAQKGAIANNKAVNFSAAKMAERLSEFGFDPRLIKDEKQLIQALNLIKEAEDQAFAQKFKGILTPKKSAKVFSLKDKKEIPNPEKNIMGGQAFEKEAEIAKGLSDKEFRSEKTSFRLNIGRNSPEFNQDLAKRIINREIYTDLSDSQRKEFLKDLDFVLKNPRDGNADGGRIGFKMGRRAFLKALGAGIGGAAALKTGLIGFGTKKAVTGAGEKIITSPVKGKPEWFDALVNKVIREGDDVTKNFATKEREIVHKLDIDNLDDIRVTQDLDEGIVRVEYNSPKNMGEDTVELVYKKPKPDEGDPNPAEEFYAVESEPRVVNPDGDMEFDGENLVGSVNDLKSDTSKLKEVATGKKQTLGEFVNSKKKKDKVKKLNEDQVEQAEYLEQKYGPAPDEDPNAFASGGLAGMLGQ